MSQSCGLWGVPELCVAVMQVVGEEALRLAEMPLVGRHPLAPLLRKMGERIRIHDDKR